MMTYFITKYFSFCEEQNNSRLSYDIDSVPVLMFANISDELQFIEK